MNRYDIALKKPSKPKARPSKPKVVNNNAPQTVKEAVTRFLSNLSASDKKFIKRFIKSKKKSELIQLHHGLGQYIRNSYDLWSGNNALLKNTGKEHPDDASMVIIKAVWDKLQK